MNIQHSENKDIDSVSSRRGEPISPLRISAPNNPFLKNKLDRNSNRNLQRSIQVEGHKNMLNDQSTVNMHKSNDYIDDEIVIQ